MKLLFTFLLLVSCCFAQSASGQEAGTGAESGPDYTAGTFYAGLTYAYPLGNYSHVYPRADALGGTFGLLVNPWKGPSPLELGLQARYLSQGNTLNRTEPGTFFNRLKTTHTMVPIHLVARVKPVQDLKVKPYIDGLVGITAFRTRSKVKEDLFDFMLKEHQALVLSRHSTTVMSYGLGVGMLFNTGKSKDTFADLRITYLQSPYADYVQKGHVRMQQDGYPLYNYSRSETSMLLVQLNLSGMLRM